MKANWHPARPSDFTTEGAGPPAARLVCNDRVTGSAQTPGGIIPRTRGPGSRGLQQGSYEALEHPLAGVTPPSGPCTSASGPMHTWLARPVTMTKQFSPVSAQRADGAQLPAQMVWPNTGSGRGQRGKTASTPTPVQHPDPRPTYGEEKISLLPF